MIRFGRGEGAVSIVLKPLDAALRDHDKIYGTVCMRSYETLVFLLM